MLYKFPGTHLVDKQKFDYTIVDANDSEAFNKALSEGWNKSTTEAIELTEKLVADEKPKTKK